MGNRYSRSRGPPFFVANACSCSIKVYTSDCPRSDANFRYQELDGLRVNAKLPLGPIVAEADFAHKRRELEIISPSTGDDRRAFRQLAIGDADRFHGDYVTIERLGTGNDDAKGACCDMPIEPTYTRRSIIVTNGGISTSGARLGKRNWRKNVWTDANDENLQPTEFFVANASAKTVRVEVEKTSDAPRYVKHGKVGTFHGKKFTVFGEDNSKIFKGPSRVRVSFILLRDGGGHVESTKLSGHEDLRQRMWISDGKNYRPGFFSRHF